MGTGKDDGVGLVVVREVEIVGFAAERELQDHHAGQTGLIAQRAHRGADLAEILGDDPR